MQVSDFRHSVDDETEYIDLIFRMLTVNGKRVFENTFEPSDIAKEYLKNIGLMYFPTVKYFEERDVYYITNCFILEELK